MRRVLQIVPRLPPAVSGVGDYALRLAHEWRTSHGLWTEFLVTDVEWAGGNSVDDFPVHRLSQRRPAAFVDCLGNRRFAGAPVLLHYVGYAYARRGAPLWLVNGLRQCIRGGDGRQLVVFFHELFAFGPFWTSAFWLSPIQRWVCREIGCLASSRFSNRALSASWLDRRIVGGQQTRVLPVFSNLGEPASLPPLAQRAPQLVIYGGLARDQAGAPLAASVVRELLARLGLSRVVTFGARRVEASLLGVPVENLGVLSAERASALLLQSRAAYLDYFDGYLGKSTVFAAYCAHGVTPVLLRANQSDADGLIAGQHFLVADDLGDRSLATSAQSVAQAASDWYRGHSLVVAARKLAESMTQRPTPC